MKNERLQGNFSIAVRPMRYSYHLDAPSTSSVLRAIEISSWYWGGDLHPIITAAMTDSKDPLADPQLYCADSHIFENLRTAASNRVKKLSLDLAHKYTFEMSYPIGIDVAYLLSNRHTISSQQETLLNNPVIPQWSEYDLFFSAVFGRITTDTQHVRSTLVTSRSLSCTTSNYWELLKSESMFPLRYTRLHLRFDKYTLYRGPHIFVMDAANNTDIIEFWNLRAIGIPIFPVITQSVENCELISLAAEIASKNSFRNPLTFEENKTFFIPSESVDKELALTFFRRIREKSLEINANCSLYEAKISDLIEHYTTNVDFPGLYTPPMRKRIQLDTESRLLTLTPVLPLFCAGDLEQRKFVNELTFHGSIDDFTFAKNFPVDLSGEKAGTLFGGLHDSRIRTERGKIVTICSGSAEHIVSFPTAVKMWSCWVEEKGYTLDTTPQGKLIAQTIKKCGGVRAINTFYSRGAIEALELFSGGKTQEYNALRGKLRQLGSDLGWTPDRFLDYMADTQIVRVGLHLKCDICAATTWIPLKNMGSEQECHKCLEPLKFPVSRPCEAKWAYKAVGIFSLSNKAEGGICVLLAIRFFQIIMHGTYTFICGAIIDNSRRKFEVDLAMFRSEEYRDTSKSEIAFVECKSQNELGSDDYDRLIELGNTFPEATLVVAVLRSSLYPKEKSRLAQIKESLALTNGGLGKLLILTTNEMCTMGVVSSKWPEAAKKSRVCSSSTLDELAAITQEIYLFDTFLT